MVIIGTEASFACACVRVRERVRETVGISRRLPAADRQGSRTDRQGDRRDVRTADGLPVAGTDSSDPGFAPGSPESGQKASFSKNPGMPPMVGGVGTVLSNLGHFPALFRALSIRQGIGTVCRMGRPYAQARAAFGTASDSGISGIGPEIPIFEESGHDPYGWWGPHPFRRQRRFLGRFRGSGPRTVIQIPHPAAACRPAGFSLGHLRVLLSGLSLR